MSNEAHDGRSDRYRAAQMAADQARVEAMQTPGPHLKLEAREAREVRLLSAGFVGRRRPSVPA
jgi:hypothetical protein